MSLLAPLTVVSPPADLAPAAPDSSLLATLPVACTALSTAVQGAVAAIPSLLAETGAINTLAVLLTVLVAELSVTELAAPALLTLAAPALTDPVRSAVQSTHTQAALWPRPVRLAPAKQSTLKWKVFAIEVDFE